MSEVRKIVIPVAGLGTRFLPASKAIPKEMVTLVDRPVVQYAVDEALAAGIDQVIFVTSRGKHAIEDHFDHAYELEDTLESKGKSDRMSDLAGTVLKAGRIAYTRQQKPLGLGHAIWCARHLVGDEPFAVTLPDVVTFGGNSLAQLVATHKRHGTSAVTLKSVPREQTKNYGIAALGEQAKDSVDITGLVEKPAPDEAPSTYHLLGRYVLDPSIFSYLERQEAGAGGEIQLTDAMLAMMGDHGMRGCIYEGEFFDCGSKEGFLKANIAIGLGHPKFGDTLRAFLKDRL